MDETALRAQITGISRQIQELETEALLSGNVALHEVIGRKKQIVAQLQRELTAVLNSDGACEGCVI